MNDHVVIVGAGPGGLMLACELALAGVRTTVLDRRTGRSHESGGALLHARCVETLRQRGIAERFGDAATPRWNRTHFGLLYIEFDDELGETEYDWLIPQVRTEELLEERALELGVEVLHGQEVTGVAQDVDGVTVTAVSAEGERTVRGAFLVGADGVHSTVARLCGFSYEDFAPAYYGVTADVGDFAGNRDQFVNGLYPGGQLGILPLQPGRIRIMTVEWEGRAVPADVPVTREEVLDSVRRLVGHAPDIAEPTWMERNGHPTRLARAYRDGRVLLVGDAAHSHPPSSGNGMVTTVHDAVNLGWKLAAEVQGRAPKGLLDSYHAERHPVGRRACVRAAAQIAIQHPLERLGPLREVLAGLVEMREVQRYLVQYVTEVSYVFDYPDVPGERHELIGTRFPEVPVTRPDGASLTTYEPLAGGRGLLLDLTGKPGALPDLPAGVADLVEVVTVEPVAALDARAVLVRPDGFVAWADRGPDGDAGLLHALREWFG
ncbi:2-polyprenyl-6-methoxyphenol hydroxylase-like FAD-dependent oxidoreductase [Actinocorallia herbida]|uniref:2-polyprenyl-6-methoxyphenol hydroxylase-like FAD-dependent oxidoreductase n=1 Tax=Actinocorallia herbida TaxID=58109 RepID=A0A3N1D1T5_9ACTN|nr:FAD-dependent monooxygenase [Actinocorallia herbida]ROO87028.1 2-polyprenyl-6-methoxyphenol hydroxylase-like FAD-dependent oxidoreductase [Actinocorallia herbida]